MKPGPFKSSGEGAVGKPAEKPAPAPAQQDLFERPPSPSRPPGHTPIG